MKTKAAPSPGTRFLGSAVEEGWPVPLDLGRLTEDGVPEPRILLPPYLPAAARVWMVGPAESAKSMFALSLGTELTRLGLAVVFFSQENPLAEDVRRLVRLRPDPAFLRFFQDQGLDLADPTHVEAVIRESESAALVGFDTLTACWSGDENDNAAIAALDREVLKPIVDRTGATVLVIDHTGHPVQFVPRKGANAPRGASSKGQKADVVLELRPKGDGRFLVHHGKNRLGRRREPDRVFEVIDTDDDGLAVIEVEVSRPRAAEVAEAMVEAIGRAGELRTNELRAAVKSSGAGRDLQTEAMKLLEAEDPPRVRAHREVVETGRGHQEAKVWRLAEEEA